MKKRRAPFTVRAQGNSMYPILQDGDLIEYIQTPFSKIKLNDIILEYVDDIFITHRVIYKTNNTCIARGDNNQQADIPIKKGHILAKVVRFQRKGKWYGIQDVYMMQSALYLSEIKKLEVLLTLNKIPHVFLKGVLVSLRYEGSIPKRIYADCDILVTRNNTQGIIKIFQLLRYESRVSDIQFKNKPEVSFTKIVNGVPVVFDVHFEPVFLMTQLRGMNLLYPHTQLEQLGDKIITHGNLVSIKGTRYSMCSQTDQILYLVLHIFHHNFTDSVRYQLLDAVIRKGFKDWEKLSQIIRDFKLEGYVYLVFKLLKKYFKTLIPQSFLRAIRPKSYMLPVTSYIIKHVDIFSQDNRAKAGIKRFILIFMLSPNPFWKKVLIFFSPETLKGVWSVLSVFGARNLNVFKYCSQKWVGQLKVRINKKFF